MSWTDLTAGVFDAAQSAFGDSVTYTPTVGSSFSAIGIFNDVYEIIQDNNTGLVTANPTLGLAYDYFPVTKPVRGDSVEIRSITYKVQEVQRDGEAGYTLQLHKG